MPNRIPNHQTPRLKVDKADDRPSAWQRGYDATWRAIRANHLVNNPMCVWCGRRAQHVDHIIPRRKGGTDDSANLQSLCHSCHSSKTAKYDR